MYRLSLVILLMLFLSACATTANYEKVLGTWVGNDVDVLVGSWGYPAKSFKAPNGNTVYAYSSSASYTMPTNTTSDYNLYGDTVYGNTTTTGGQTLNYWCNTYFEVNEQNIITSWSYKGNNCKSK